MVCMVPTYLLKMQEAEFEINLMFQKFFNPTDNFIFNLYCFINCALFYFLLINYFSYGVQSPQNFT